MATRTASARGRIDNTGNVETSFRVRLVTDVLRGGTRIYGDNSEHVVVLGPGASSDTIELAHNFNIDGGDQAVTQLFLDRVSPEPAADIDQGPVQSFTEPIVVGGRLVSL